ncbi:hypothetical protein AGMMS49944_30530 [Spirochaetia bacterium]|nr:hypothetical protein AGMMS49944_30530 [Spirochaetia bacterium]
MPEEALTAFRRAVGIKPDYAPAHREIGRILFSKGDFRGAVNAFTTALRYTPGGSASLREMGAAQMALRDFTAAETSFAKALQVSPGDDQTNYNMAVLMLSRNKGAEAFPYAKQAADSVPANAVYVYTLGLAHEAAGDVDAAAAAYNRAITLDAAYIRPRINLGSLYLSNGRAEEALNLLTAAYNQQPGSFEVNNNLGAAYARLEQWGRSVEHYGKALQSEPDNPTVRMNLARALVGSGDLAKARDAYLECLKLDAANWDARLELGKTYVSLGERDSAKRSLEELVSRNPNYTGKAEAERILSGL